MRFDPVRRELVLKIVYYGPGLAGKTTNLSAIRTAAGTNASDLVSVEAHSERTLHFDWLNINVGQVNGVNVRYELWTVPGQSYYAATRRSVLAGASGVVFVADSRREALDENIDSMNEMLGNLRHHGLADDLPVVMQFNKQDLPTAVKREQLEPLMNVRGWPSFAAVATTGRGVSETAALICQLVAERAASEPLPPIDGGRTTVAETGSCLISCHRCQTMLEVPSALPGEIYSCGVCNSVLEVVDGDHGLTREPTTVPTTADISPRSVLALADDYAADQIASYTPTGGNVALQPAPSSAHAPAANSEAAFEIPGYTIVSSLDQTAQGRRFRVREVASGRTFRALSISSDLLLQPAYRDGLEPYVRLAGPVKHPNLLPLVTLRTHGEAVVFLSADPTDYEPLSHVLARRRALAPPHAMGLLRQMVLALEEGSRHGAVHGWLRPDCILVGGDGTVVVDELCVPVNHRFLVKELAGASAATEYYLAPEHLQDDARSDIRSDMFVLGALLFRMMTGEGLVTGYNAHEALHKISANGPRMLRDAAQGISRELNIFYQKLVAADRRERFQSYRELVEALDRFGGGAKRQNIQLTAPQTRGTRPAARTSQAGTPRRSGGTSSLTGMAQSRTRSAAPSNTTLPRQKNKDSGFGVVIVVAVIVAIAIAAVIALQSNRPATVGPTIDDRATPKRAATPTPTTPTQVKVDAPRPPTTSAATGGAVMPLPPSPEPVVVANIPTPEVVAPPTPDTAADRLTIQRDIADLLVKEHYKAALDACARLDDDEQRAAKDASIRTMHAERRVAIAALVEAGKPLETIREAIEPALTVWGMAGDDEWARAQISRAVQRLPVVAADPTIPAPPGTAPVQAAGFITVNLDAAASALTQLEQALAANQPALAAQAVDSVNAQTPDGKALRRMADQWALRLPLLARAVGARKAKLRLPHPTTNEAWDVTGADAQGVLITAPNGSSTNLAWSQIAAKTQGKLFLDAGNAPGTTPDEAVSVAVMQLIADEPSSAQLMARKARGNVPTDIAGDLDRLIALHARRSLVAAIQRAQEAARADNGKALVEAVNDVRRFDSETQAPYADAIAQLEAMAPATASKPGTETTKAAQATGLKERQEAVRALGWEPVGGTYLDPNGLILPAGTGQASGLSRAFAANLSGFSLAIKGTGQFMVLPGKPSNKTQGGLTLTLNGELSRYTVRFIGGILSISEGGVIIQSQPLATIPTAITFLVLGEATMPNAPSPLNLTP